MGIEPRSINLTTNKLERIILINSFTQGMMVIEGTSSIDTLMQLANEKSGQPPASKASIETMPRVEIDVDDDDGGDGDNDCVICLEGWVGKGKIAKEIHEECIKKWLRIHGSCPVCWFNMPVEDSPNEKKIDDDGDDQERREFWVSFNFNGEIRIRLLQLRVRVYLQANSPLSESEHHDQEFDG